MTSSIQTVSFHGQQLAVIPQQEKLFVAIKPICENIGLAWGSQYNRLQRDEVLSSTVSIMKTVAEDDKTRELICLPLEMLNGWLFGIDTNRIKNPEVKARVIEYKRECYQVLFDYWTKGTATNPRKTTPKTKPGQLTLDQQVSIKELVNARVEALPHRKQAGAAIRCWSALKSKFGCSYKQIPTEQFTEAASLVARLPLDGELLLKQEAPALPQIARLDELKDQGNLIAITEHELLHVHRLMGRMVLTYRIFNRYELYKVSKALGSRFGVEMMDQVAEGDCDAHKLKHLEPMMSSIYAKRMGDNAGSVFN